MVEYMKERTRLARRRARRHRGELAAVGPANGVHEDGERPRSRPLPRSASIQGGRRMTEVTEKPAEATESHRPPQTDRPRGAGLVLLTGVVSIARVFVAWALVVWASFDFLRDADANRFVVIGRRARGRRRRCLRAVLGDEPGRRLAARAPPRGRAAVRVHRARPRDARGVPDLSGDQHDHHQFQGRERPGVRRARELQVRLHRREHVARDAQHRAVDRARAARRGERSVWCSPRWPTGCAAARRSRSR